MVCLSNLRLRRCAPRCVPIRLVVVHGELGQLAVLKCRSSEAFAEEMEGALLLCTAVLSTQIEIA